ncbi:MULTISPECIES: hypothetical protein [Streptomyces]|uniref:Transposase n=1 Tax=Streptomyces virginiae TaxID=1961 RepID=A0ABZ1TML6_STRVG|nr:hypothetical protein [Streptomyces virginiae]WTB27125.1 hypothetical protein OG253_39805 [Streptomyces virginiae]
MATYCLRLPDQDLTDHLTELIAHTLDPAHPRWGRLWTSPDLTRCSAPLRKHLLDAGTQR